MGMNNELDLQTKGDGGVYVGRDKADGSIVLNVTGDKHEGGVHTGGGEAEVKVTLADGMAIVRTILAIAHERIDEENL